MALPRLSMSGGNGPYTINLPQHRRLSGCSWMLTVIKSLTSTNLHQRGCKFPTFQCSLILVCMPVISTAPMSTGVRVITSTARMETAYWPGPGPIISPFFTIPRMNLAFILSAGTLALTRILPSSSSVLIVASLLDAFWRSFLGHNIDLRL